MECGLNRVYVSLTSVLSGANVIDELMAHMRLNQSASLVQAGYTVKTYVYPRIFCSEFSIY